MRSPTIWDQHCMLGRKNLEKLNWERVLGPCLQLISMWILTSDFGLGFTRFDLSRCERLSHGKFKKKKRFFLSANFPKSRKGEKHREYVWWKKSTVKYCKVSLDTSVNNRCILGFPQKTMDLWTKQKQTFSFVRFTFCVSLSLEPERGKCHQEKQEINDTSCDEHANRSWQPQTIFVQRLFLQHAQHSCKIRFHFSLTRMLHP